MPFHLLIFGFGYTAHFLAQHMQQHNVRVTATTRHPDTLGYDPMLACELIAFSEESVERALKTATHVLISTPPVVDLGDPVLAAFEDLLKKHINTIPWIGYLSSTSVYGDHQGDWVDETTAPHQLGAQGILRFSAEQQWVALAQEHKQSLTVFRLAGIYGPQRNVLARLKAGKTETVVKEGQFFSRIHVVDIVAAIVAAMQHPQPGVTIYNVADDEPTPSDVVDQYAATLLHLPPLKEIAYEQASLSAMAQEFYSHNKRVSNLKLKTELNLKLTYPTYQEGLVALLDMEGYTRT